jgi:hypothetical protein
VKRVTELLLDGPWPAASQYDVYVYQHPHQQYGDNILLLIGAQCCSIATAAVQ